MTNTKSVLVTGCSAGGIGCALAYSLAKRGHHVWASARTPSKIPSELTSLPNVTSLALDVTSGDSVNAAVKTVAAAGGLDVLVNNAGTGYTTPLLDADLDTAERVYSTNLWGVLRTCQAFADQLVTRRGKIINVSSAGGAVSTPWLGVYCSSKAALTNMSETLRIELSPFGVSVVTIMVGTITTPFHVNEPPLVLPSSSYYRSITEIISGWRSGELQPKGWTAEQFAESVVDEMMSSGADGLLWKGPRAYMIKVLSVWCPVWLYEVVLKKEFGFAELTASVEAERRKGL